MDLWRCFVLKSNKQWRKQSSCRWFEIPLRSCDVTGMLLFTWIKTTIIVPKVFETVHARNDVHINGNSFIGEMICFIFKRPENLPGELDGCRFPGTNAAPGHGNTKHVNSPRKWGPHYAAFVSSEIYGWLFFPGAPLLTWTNFNPTMDKQSHAQ